ncbi:MAG: glycosyltransferase family 4 protein [Sideroxydans sp.]|jgi:glycosyltransferase involved in cell wall biosynthesis
MSKKLMFVVNVDWFFMSHRLPIALEAKRQGYEVHIATGITDQKEAMEKCGLIVHSISIDRSSPNLIGLMRTFFQLLNLFLKVRPDLVHLVTIKPVLLGGIAARMARIPAVVAAISGLGYVFLDRGWVSRRRQQVVSALYRIALGHSNLKVIFQNEDDRIALMRLTDLQKGQVEMIRGSGVDLDRIKATPLPTGVPVVMLIARLIADKGVREFIAASSILNQSGHAIRCCLVGTTDPENPSSLSEEELCGYEVEGIIERWGYRSDIGEVLKEAHIVVLPSYREGLPKVLLEAAAAGRPVITTDVPGCRDAIDIDVSGVLVPVADAEALAASIRTLVDDRERCVGLGIAGRALAEREFDIKQVVRRHLQIYQNLTEGAP